MRRSFSSLTVVLLAFATVAGTADAAFARGNSPVRNTGPIIIIGPVDCEKKLVQQCHWEGNRHVCVWVPSTDCEIY